MSTLVLVTGPPGTGTSILDGVARTAEVDATRELSLRCSATSVMISTACSDPAVHRARTNADRAGA